MAVSNKISLEYDRRSLSDCQNRIRIVIARSLIILMPYISVIVKKKSLPYAGLGKHTLRIMLNSVDSDYNMFNELKISMYIRLHITTSDEFQKIS